MTSREQFEQYAATRNLNVARKGDGYVAPTTDYDWQAWQASRLALVVDLSGCEQAYDVGVYIGDITDALNAAGVRYE